MVRRDGRGGIRAGFAGVVAGGERRVRQVSDALIVHTLGCFRLTKTALVVDGEPTFEEAQQVGDWIEVVQGAVQFWWGDWMRYMHTREDFKDKLSQALSVNSYAIETMHNLQYVAEHVEPSRRRDGVSWSVHAEVASLPPAEQDAILDKAAADHMTVAAVRADVKAAKQSASGSPVAYWAVISCASAEDQAALIDRMKLEGRTVKRQSEALVI
jgi:hypothetical protein